MLVSVTDTKLHIKHHPLVKYRKWRELDTEITVTLAAKSSFIRFI